MSAPRLFGPLALAPALWRPCGVRAGHLELAAKKEDLAPVPNCRCALGKAAAHIEADVAQAPAGDGVHAGSTRLLGARGEGFDQCRADALASEASIQVDVQMGWKAPRQRGKGLGEVVDVGKGGLS